MSEVRWKTAEGILSRAVGATPADVALINQSYARAPVTAESIHVREMHLAHDQYDRTFERFPKSYLDRFAETIPGKSMLAGHDTGSLPLGKFFRAALESVAEDAFPVPEGAKEIRGDSVAAFKAERRSVSYLTPSFYFPNDEQSAPFVTRIDQGVYDFSSIGFRYDDIDCYLCGKSYLGDCPHVAGRTYEKGLCLLTYSGDAKRAEAMEGSIVYLGAQQGARIKGMLEGGAVDPSLAAWTPYGTDLVTLKGAEQLARELGHARKVWMAAPAAGDAHMTEAEMQAKIDAAEAARVKAEDARIAAEAATKAAQDAHTADLASLTKERDALKVSASLAEAALKDLADTYVAHAVRLGRQEGESRDIAALYQGKGDYATLKSRVDALWAEVCERWPAGVSGDPSNRGGDDKPVSGRRPARPEEYQLV